MVAALTRRLSAAAGGGIAFDSANPLARGQVDGSGAVRQLSFRVPDTGAALLSSSAGDSTAASQAVVAARSQSLRRAFSTVKRAEPPLPPGWTEFSSHNGTPYWKSASGTVSWSRPAQVAGGSAAPAPLEAPAVAAEPDAPLPAGWQEKFSRSQQRPYWWNEVTSETSWERPH